MLNIINALDFYGLSTNSLHSEVTAQMNGDDGDGDQPGNGDNTGGGTTTGGTDPKPPTPPVTDPNIMTNARMVHTEKTVKASANEYGTVRFNNKEYSGYSPLVEYTVNYIDHQCEKYSFPTSDSCDTNKEWKEFLSISGGNGTGSGTGTGGEGPATPND